MDAITFMSFSVSSAAESLKWLFLQLRMKKQNQIEIHPEPMTPPTGLCCFVGMSTTNQYEQSLGRSRLFCDHHFYPDGICSRMTALLSAGSKELFMVSLSWPSWCSSCYCCSTVIVTSEESCGCDAIAAWPLYQSTACPISQKYSCIK